MRVMAIIVIAGLIVGALASVVDPRINFPVVSQVVCSMKGDTWYDGGILGAPGCYAPSP